MQEDHLRNTPQTNEPPTDIRTGIPPAPAPLHAQNMPVTPPVTQMNRPEPAPKLEKGRRPKQSNGILSFLLPLL